MVTTRWPPQPPPNEPIPSPLARSHLQLDGQCPKRVHCCGGGVPPTNNIGYYIFIYDSAVAVAVAAERQPNVGGGGSGGGGGSLTVAWQRGGSSAVA